MLRYSCLDNTVHACKAEVDVGRVQFFKSRHLDPQRPISSRTGALVFHISDVLLYKFTAAVQTFYRLDVYK